MNIFAEWSPEKPQFDHSEQSWTENETILIGVHKLRLENLDLLWKIPEAAACLCRALEIRIQGEDPGEFWPSAFFTTPSEEDRELLGTYIEKVASGARKKHPEKYLRPLFKRNLPQERAFEEALMELRPLLAASILGSLEIKRRYDKLILNLEHIKLNAQKVVLNNKFLAINVLNSFCRSHNVPEQFNDDLEQAALQGLARGVLKWIPGQKAKLSTFATFWIRDGVRRCFQSMTSKKRTRMIGCSHCGAITHKEIKANEKKVKCAKCGHEMDFDDAYVPLQMVSLDNPDNETGIPLMDQMTAESGSLPDIQIPEDLDMDELLSRLPLRQRVAVCFFVGVPLPKPRIVQGEQALY